MTKPQYTFTIVLIAIIAGLVGWHFGNQPNQSQAAEAPPSAPAKTPTAVTSPPTFEFNPPTLSCSTEDNVISIIMRIDGALADVEVFFVGKESTPGLVALHQQTLSAPRDRSVRTVARGETITLTSALSPNKSWSVTYKGKEGERFAFEVQ
ncbi:MAG: hypothetical protein RJB39_438 [Candidatus Parcubacteria bacterium]